MRQSVTFDRGTEFAFFATLKRSLEIESYFCKPQAPWQKGTVENTNGRLRRFLPSDTDIALIPPEKLLELTTRLNRIPRNVSDTARRRLCLPSRSRRRLGHGRRTVSALRDGSAPARRPTANALKP